MECSPRIPWVEDSNGGAECSPGNSFVNSWVERMCGADPNMRCSPGNSCRNARVRSRRAEEDCSPGNSCGNAWVERKSAMDKTGLSALSGEKK